MRGRLQRVKMRGFGLKRAQARLLAAVPRLRRRCGGRSPRFPQCSRPFPDCRRRFPGCNWRFLDCKSRFPGCRRRSLECRCWLRECRRRLPDCGWRLIECESRSRGCEWSSHQCPHPLGRIARRAEAPVASRRVAPQPAHSPSHSGCEAGRSASDGESRLFWRDTIALRPSRHFPYSPRLRSPTRGWLSRQ